jgi:putative membrane protein
LTRLHPLTPILRSLSMIALAVAAVSWQGFRELGPVRFGQAIVVGLVALIIYSAVTWRISGYQVVGRELRIQEGLVWRRTRAIPLERVQSVEVVRPALARVFGLAQLRLEVVGGSRTEAPLSYLTAAEAQSLRERLLNVARPGSAPAGTEEGRIDQPERLVHQMANRDLLVSQLLNPQWWWLVVGVGGPILYYLLNADVSTIGILSLVTALIGAAQLPINMIGNWWGFRVGLGPDGLRIHRGLLEKRSQTVPAGRVQALAVRWPLTWRGQGWVRIQIQVAGLPATEGNNQLKGGVLLPVGDVPTARTLAAHALAGFDLTSVAVVPVPPRAGWLAPISRRVLGCALTPAAFVTRRGLVTRELVVVPYARVQSVRVRQGPVQRLLRLATVYADTAGGGLTPVAEHRDVIEARALAAELADRSRAARRSPTATPPPTPDRRDPPAPPPA